MQSRCVFWLVVALVAGVSPGGAQGGQSCPAGRISHVFIDSHSVFDLSDPDRKSRFDWAYRMANRLHVPTREGVIRRELTFAVGDCYDPERLKESERALRSTDYIADVDVYGIRQSDGSYHVVVDTQDEWSTQVDIRISQQDGFEGARLREYNLLGTGQEVSLFWLRSYDTRVYGAAYRTPQLLGTRWDAEIAAGRTPTGYLFSETFYYPFLGEEGRWAARQSFEHADRYFGYLAEVEDGTVRILLPERRRSFELSGVRRTGPRGDLTFFGVGVAGEWISYDAPRFRGAEGDSAMLRAVERLDTVSSVRGEVIAGKRRVHFVRRRALDTVHGREDVPLGMQVEMALGRSLPGLSSDDDLALSLGFFAAGEVEDRWYSGGRIQVEAKRDYQAPAEESEWNDVYGQADAWAYWRPIQEGPLLLVSGLSVAAGWFPSVPFQLTLGERAGLRGYPDDLHAVSRRWVATLEARTYFGAPFADLFDLGGVAFADVGRGWAGSVPFGRDAPLLGSVGVGLRGAFPPGSQKTYRIDVALPLDDRPGWRDLVISIGVGQAIGLSAAERDLQLHRSVRGGISSSLFEYPR